MHTACACAYTNENVPNHTIKILKVYIRIPYIGFQFYIFPSFIELLNLLSISDCRIRSHNIGLKTY